MNLQALSTSLSRISRLSYGWALMVVVLVLLAILFFGGWLIGARLSQQVGQLSQALPGSLAQIRGQLEQYPWGRWLIGHGFEAGQWLFGEAPASGVTGLASGAITFVIDVVVILFVGLYGAAQPDWYVRGFLHLVPFSKRDRARETLEAAAYTLRWWLFGQLFSMVVVGGMTGLGLWLLDFQLPLALGLLAFALEIVPNIGPIVAAVPAVLLAWVQGPWEVLYVILLYIGIHIVEGYLLMPLVQLHTIRLSPAMHILAVVSLGILVDESCSFWSSPTRAMGRGFETRAARRHLDVVVPRASCADFGHNDRGAPDDCRYQQVGGAKLQRSVYSVQRWYVVCRWLPKRAFPEAEVASGRQRETLPSRI